MDFSLNLTLFVQIINFLIAFFLLKYFLFKPAFEVLDKKEDKISDLKTEIEFYGKQIEEKKSILQEIKDKARNKFEKYLSFSRPSFFYLKFEHQIKRLDINIDKKEVIADLGKVIVKKAKHGV